MEIGAQPIYGGADIFLNPCHVTEPGEEILKSFPSASASCLQEIEMNVHPLNTFYSIIFCIK